MLQFCMVTRRRRDSVRVEPQGVLVAEDVLANAAVPRDGHGYVQVLQSMVSEAVSHTQQEQNLPQADS